MINNMMKKQQQFGSMRRGNPVMEQMMGGLMRGIMPKKVGLPTQTMQGGFGNMGKLAIGHGNRSLQRYANKPNLQKFLMQYSQYGKRNIKFADPNKLIKF